MGSSQCLATKYGNMDTYIAWGALLRLTATGCFQSFFQAEHLQPSPKVNILG